MLCKFWVTNYKFEAKKQELGVEIQKCNLNLISTAISDKLFGIA